MKTLQKYILSLLMIVSTVSMYAMNGREHQTSSLQAIVAKQGQAKLEQASSLQNVVAIQAREKTSKKLNLQSDILSVDLLKNEILEYLVGSSGHDQDKKPYFTFTIDRKIRPWMLIDKQRGAIVQAVQTHKLNILKESCRLLDVYTLLFISPKAPKSSDFIKNYKNEYGMTLLHIACFNQDVELMRLLLDRGANVDARDDLGMILIMNCM